MAELHFSVLGAEAVAYCAVPTMSLRLRIESDDPEQRLEGISLDCQIRIEAQKRRYGDGETRSLYDLFGPKQDWSRTLRSLLWTHVNVTVPPFTGRTEVEMHVPCSYDFNVVAARYLHGLEEGDVPLLLLFSGSLFDTGAGGELQITRLPWTSETSFRLPVEVWKSVIEIYYPNSVWLCLHRDAFDRLAAFKSARALPSWERALEELLRSAEEPDPA